MTHNGMDIDQFLLLTIYPTVAFFAVGYIGKKITLSDSLKYGLQSLTSFAFSFAYFILVPNGNAQGIAIVLLLFGIILLVIARKYKLSSEIHGQKI
ncbi:MAG TPA: hypothetical protein VFH04_03100 [Nitrososphaeraceae archaeon]|jgi:hypothetical protein|nr:hypothetical protein [Nitrososphaeraceae archaeon]